MMVGIWLFHAFRLGTDVYRCARNLFKIVGKIFRAAERFGMDYLINIGSDALFECIFYILVSLGWLYVTG